MWHDAYIVHEKCIIFIKNKKLYNFVDKNQDATNWANIESKVNKLASTNDT
jgi:hypothetical protein